MSRAAIRDDVVTRLTGQIPGGAPVLPLASTPTSAADCPCVNVYTPRSTEDRISDGPPTFRVRQTLAVEAFVNGTDEGAVGDDLDAIDDAILDTLLSDPGFVGQFERVDNLRSVTGPIEVGEYRFIALRREFEVVYVRSFDPSIEDDFATMHTQVDFISPGAAGPDGTSEATLETELEVVP